eukprot:TRINITY_DN9821_c0_g2_i2.p1 TRINITY_DN9821_c0_g2~~TRINITY_DN9821_c0_g2_i2.p1  ORF type:complete len:775 (+),score=234.82 TRINITY_DN9821_c0_g2_i2:175-2499(+)
MSTVQEKELFQKINKANEKIQAVVHLNRQRLDILPAIYKDQQLAKAAAFDHNYLQEMIAQRHMTEIQYVKKLDSALENMIQGFKTDMVEQRQFDDSMIGDLVKQMTALNAAAHLHEDTIKSDLLKQQHRTIQQLQNKYSNQKVTDVSASLQHYTNQLAQAQVDSSQALTCLKNRLTLSQTQALTHLLKAEHDLDAATHQLRLDLLSHPPVHKAQDKILQAEKERCEKWRGTSASTGVMWADTVTEYRLNKLVTLCHKVRESIYAESNLDEITTVNSLSKECCLLHKQLDNDVILHATELQASLDAAEKTQVHALCKTDGLVNKARADLLAAHLVKVDPRGGVQAGLRDLDRIVEAAAESQLSELEDDILLSGPLNQKLDRQDDDLSQLHRGLELHQEQFEQDVRLSFERRLEQKDMDDRLKNATTSSTTQDQLQQHKTRLKAAKLELQHTLQSLQDASKTHAFELSQRQSDEQVAIFKSHIANTLTTMQQHSTQQRQHWGQKLRLQRQSHLQDTEEAVSCSLSCTVQHMQQLHELVQQKLELSLVEQADARRELEHGELQLEKQVCRGKEKLAELEEKLRVSNDGCHAREAEHCERMNQIFIKHQQNVSEYVLSDTALGTATQDEMELTVSQKETEFSLGVESMLGCHIGSVGDMVTEAEARMAEAELQAGRERALVKKQHTSSVKQLALEGQQQLSKNEGTIVEYEDECSGRCNELVLGLQDMVRVEGAALLDAAMGQFEETLRVEQAAGLMHQTLTQKAEVNFVEKFVRIIT